MDRIRSCYRVQMNFGPGNERVWVQWYFVPKGTKMYVGPTVFRSDNWLDRETDDLSGRGEVDPGPRPWVSGRRPWFATPCTFLGTPEEYLHGLPAGLSPCPPRVPSLVIGLGLKMRWRDWFYARGHFNPRLMADLSLSMAGSTVARLLATLSLKAGLADVSHGFASLAAAYILRGLDSQLAAAANKLNVTWGLKGEEAYNLQAKCFIVATFAERAGLTDLAAGANKLGVALTVKASQLDVGNAAAHLSALLSARATDSDVLQAAARLNLHLVTLLKSADTLAGQANLLAAFAEKAGLTELRTSGIALSLLLGLKGKEADSATSAAVLAALEGLKTLLAEARTLIAASTEGDRSKLSVSVSFAAFQMVTPAGGCGSLPANLMARFGPATGTCSIPWNGLSTGMSYNSVTGLWSHAIGLFGGQTFTLTCGVGSWKCAIMGSCVASNIITMTGTSGPSPNLTGHMDLTGCCTGTVQITITRT
jgi:hypothetical protein